MNYFKKNKKSTLKKLCVIHKIFQFKNTKDLVIYYMTQKNAIFVFWQWKLKNKSVSFMLQDLYSSSLAEQSIGSKRYEFF